MFEESIGGIKIQCVKGDITNQDDVVAIVNAANKWLRSGGGVAGAIHRKAGPQLEEECSKLAPIKPGDAVITKGYNLPNKYVIHCLGPVYGIDKPEEEILSMCYENALKLAEKNKIDSIAFPAISTGYFCFPFEEASEVAVKTILENIKKLDNVKIIRFVLYTEKEFEKFKKILEKNLKKFKKNT
uniref:Macro domain-containing protein n=1 Tax=candidate division WOR-3 bacterium TaxID=2052148 RepID=A0A7C4UC35_UNCW3